MLDGSRPSKLFTFLKDTWIGLNEFYVTKSANKITRIQQRPDEDEKRYGARSKDYVAECSSAYFDGMLVYYRTQKLLPTTEDSFTKALHHLTTDQRYSLRSVIRSAKVEGQTNCPYTARYEKTVTVQANQQAVMLIANPLYRPFDDYSTGLPTSLEPELNTFLLVPDRE